MRVGTICYATDQGLGNLAKSFYDSGLVNDALIVKHAHYKTHNEWYPDDAITMDVRAFDKGLACEFCSDMDLMIFFETPFNWDILRYCREHNVKTVLMPMYECTPKVLPHKPDLFLCPSVLDLDYFPENSVYLPVPVDERIDWYPRREARVFLHNAGHGGLRNRNGTGQLLDAMRYVKSPIKLVIRTQHKLQWKVDDPRVEVVHGTLPFLDLYPSWADVFVFPDKFNGLSMPLQEALCSGMAVMASDRYPANTYLPRDPLIPVNRFEKASVSPRCLEFDEAVIEPEAIARTIDRWYGKYILDLSLAGRISRKQYSWDHLYGRYIDVFNSLLATSPRS